GENLLAVDAAGEGSVLELLLDGLDVHVRDRLARPNERHRRDETDQLVDGVEDLLHRRRPGRVRVVGVGQDAVPDFLRTAPLLEDLRTLDGVLANLRETLVVVIVEEADDAPGFRVTAVLRGVRS